MNEKFQPSLANTQIVTFSTALKMEYTTVLGYLKRTAKGSSRPPAVTHCITVK